MYIWEKSVSGSGIRHTLPPAWPAGQSCQKMPAMHHRCHHIWKMLEIWSVIIREYGENTMLYGYMVHRYISQHVSLDFIIISKHGWFMMHRNTWEPSTKEYLVNSCEGIPWYLIYSIHMLHVSYIYLHFYHRFKPNVGKHTPHGASGVWSSI